MSKRRKKKVRSPRPRKRLYDVEMIRDFLDHLLWELRINHLENTNPGMKPNPELVSQLAKYQKKYNTVGLMCELKINACGAPENIVKRAAESFSSARAQISQRYIETLEELQPAFETAFECASNPDAFMVQEINMDELTCFLRGQEGDDETSEAGMDSDDE